MAHLLWFFFISVASASPSKPNYEDFVQCLEKHCQPSNFISEAIFTPNNSLFTIALTNYTRNLRFTTPSTPKPVIILKANHESHVQAAITCCKEVGLQMRIRSGGHDYDGLSYVSQVPFIILDTSNMRKIQINVAEETATAQAGASLGELYYRIAEKSNVLAFPAGVCPTLGLGGHISGGGYGNLLRKYGLSIDNVVDAQIVDANGKILDRKSMGEDLFWAIRGGGGASFGVILSWTLKLVRVPENVTVFKVPTSVEQGATDLVYKWEQIADKIDEDLFIRVMIDPVNSTEPGKKTVNATFVGMFLGDSGRLLTLMKSSFPELGLQKNDCKEMKWVNSTIYWVGFPPGTPIEALLDKIPKWPTSFLTRKSDYVKQPISKQGLEAIWKVVIEQDVSMQWNPYGGKMGQIPPTETAFPHRAGNLFLAQYTANWNDQNLTETYLKKVRTLFEAMTPYVSKNPREAFLNYRDIDIGSIGSNGNGTFQEANVYGTKIFKDNFERLVRTKTAVDPDNFFRYEQSIPTKTKGRL
ncbi:berberine bridge enzyme-like 8 [Euphorbia lathyris]|uniref:berberine bridge enzyme-like 8 n=1 Tax=Euphorbia lathyris TaxID=212925 RepID=UPI0033139463